MSGHTFRRCLNLLTMALCSPHFRIQMIEVGLTLACLKINRTHEWANSCPSALLLSHALPQAASALFYLLALFIFTRLSNGGGERAGGEPLFTVRNRPEEGGNLGLGTLRNFFPKIRPSLTCIFGPPAGANLPLSFNQDCRKW